MSQTIEIFFAEAPMNSIEAAILPVTNAGTDAQHIAVCYRLVGSRAVMSREVGENWWAIVICTPEFAKAHAATPGKLRPFGLPLSFLRGPE